MAHQTSTPAAGWRQWHCRPLPLGADTRFRTVRKRTDEDCEFSYVSLVLKELARIAMNFIVWLVVGSLIGWVASMIMGTSGRQGILLNVAIGIVGAALGGWMLSGPFGRTNINQGNFSLYGLVVPLLVAIILLTFVRLARGSASR